MKPRAQLRKQSRQKKKENKNKTNISMNSTYNLNSEADAKALKKQIFDAVFKEMRKTDSSQRTEKANAEWGTSKKKPPKSNGEASEAGGLQFSANRDQASRMAALQQFISTQSNSNVDDEEMSADDSDNSEVKKDKKSAKKKKDKSEKPKRKFKNKIDQARYESIKEDMEQDIKEINLFSKKVGSSSKKDNTKAVANIFGSHIGSLLDFGDDSLLAGELTDEEDLENESCAVSQNASPGEESSDSEVSEEDKPVDKQKKRKSVVNNQSVDSHGEPSKEVESVEVHRKQKKRKLSLNDSGASNGHNDSLDESNLKSILKTPKAKKKKCKLNRRVSFDLGQNDTLEIPPNDNNDRYQWLVSKIRDAEDQSDYVTNDDSDSWEEISDDGSDDEEDSDEIGEEDSNEIVDDSSEEEGDIKTKINIPNGVSSNDDKDESSNDDDEYESTDEDSEASDPSSNDVKSSVTEDIYGRLKDDQGNVIKNSENGNVGYVSPANRKKDAQLQEQLSTDAMKKVRQELRSILNKLASINIPASFSQVCRVYASNARQLTNILFSDLLLNRLCPDTPVLSRHAMEVAMMVGAISAKLGCEIGGHILTDFVVSWDSNLATASPTKTANALHFVCFLHLFGVVHAQLVYNILEKLASDPSIANLDQMITIIRCIGFEIRKDDPLAMRDLILRVEGLTPAEGKEKRGELHQLLVVVRNNNPDKMEGYDASYPDQLKKQLSTLVGGSPPAPLKVSLEDLLLCEERGRWWIVGSAFTGGSKQVAKNAVKDVKEEGASQFSADFMYIAKNMKMTKPPHINILFVMTKGCSNCDEAAQKLIQMNLPKAQERIIFDVMTMCVQKMNPYVSYYTNMAKYLCQSNGKYRIMLTRRIWDRLSEFSLLRDGEVGNLANFIVEIVDAKCVNIAVLKTLPFTEGSPKLRTFLEKIFLKIFDDDRRSLCEGVFQNLPTSDSLVGFKQILKSYIERCILGKFKKGSLKVKSKDFENRISFALDLLSSQYVAKL